MTQHKLMYVVRYPRRLTGVTSEAYETADELKAPQGSPQSSCPTKSVSILGEKKTIKMNPVKATSPIWRVRR